MANDKDFKVNGPVVVGKDTKVTVGSISSSAINLATGNYFDDTLAADTTYTISNAGAVQAFQLEVTGGAVGFDVSAGVYDSVSFSVASQDTNPLGLVFNNDGTKLYVVGSTSDTVYQYSLSTAFDISTTSYDSVSFSVNSQEATPTDIAFNNDGTKLYIVGASSRSVHQYSLSSAFDLSTASYDSVSFSFNSQDTSTYGIAFNNAGTKIYMVGNTTDSLYQYSLSTAFDISTTSYDSVSFSVASQDSTPRGVAFNTDGTKMILVGITGDNVYQYSLSTAFDLSTASYDSVSFSIGQDTAPSDIVFNSDGTKMYILGATNDTIYQYSTSVDATLTWPTSIEWAGGIAPAAPANGETDVYTFTTDDTGTSYTGVKSIDNAS
jgi:DNA-binding beta-propeller fold protein YncE